MQADVTFHPGWWHDRVGIDFDRKFFWDTNYRLEADRAMRRALFEHFGDVGLGERDPQPRPILGSDLIASGFLFSEILGCEVRYSAANPPEVLSAKLSSPEVLKLRTPELKKNALWQDVMRQASELEAKFGYVESHLNLQGVQNLALDLRGSEIYLDFYTEPATAKHLLTVCAELMLQTGKILAQHSRVLSHGVTAITRQVMPEVYLTSNCTVEMVSLAMYEEFLLPFDRMLAKEFRPFGIHHCGQTMEHVVTGYAKVQPEFAEVGAFSNIRKVREALPEVFLNLRYSPVRLKDVSKPQLAMDIEDMILANGNREKASLSCVGIDSETSDDIIKEFVFAAQQA